MEDIGINTTGFIIFCVLRGVFLLFSMEMMRRDIIFSAWLLKLYSQWREMKKKEKEERGALLLAGDEYLGEDCLDEGGEKSVETVARSGICLHPEKGEDLDGSDDEHLVSKSIVPCVRFKLEVFPCFSQ